MAPQNNLERKAARKLAASAGIKYTEALRRLRASGIQPTDVLKAPTMAAQAMAAGASATPEQNPLSKEECPGDFLWSAFGANYPDTQCQNGQLVDMDSLNISEIPCPYCNPGSFTEYMFDLPTIPECAACAGMLPLGTEIHYHENDQGSLWWSASCPACGLQRVNMVDHGDDEDEDMIDHLVEWLEQESRAGQALAGAVQVGHAEAVRRMRIAKVQPVDLLAAAAGVGADLTAQTLLIGGIPELYSYDPAQPELVSLRFRNPAGQALVTTPDGAGWYTVEAQPIEIEASQNSDGAATALPSFSLGMDAAPVEQLRVVLDVKSSSHTAVIGDGAATTAELVRICEELVGQGVPVTVFSGTPGQAWPEGARVIRTGSGHWAAASEAAERMTDAFVSLLLRPLDNPEPLVILVDAPSMGGVDADLPADDRVHAAHLAHLWGEWVLKARVAGWTLVLAMAPGGTWGIRDMSWVLVPDAAAVPWAGWPAAGRAARGPQGAIRALRPLA